VRFPEESEAAAAGVAVDQSTHLFRAHASLPGHPIDLLLGVHGADVGIEPRAAGQECVGSDIDGPGPVELGSATTKNRAVRPR
jgi:hypothetical protein